jgi:hypothetical protein
MRAYLSVGAHRWGIAAYRTKWTTGDSTERHVPHRNIRCKREKSAAAVCVGQQKPHMQGGEHSRSEIISRGAGAEEEMNMSIDKISNK